MRRMAVSAKLALALATVALIVAAANAVEPVGQTPPSRGKSWIRGQVQRSGASFVSPDPAIVKVLLVAPDGVRECSGAVISRNKVLTAAHCLIDDQGNWVPGRLTVIPGLDGWQQEPWGRFEVTSAVDDGFDYATGDNDVAVLSVGRNARGERIGDVTGWFGIASRRSGQDVQGYAGHLAEQQHEVCSSVRYFSRTMEHDCFTPQGMSGSPVFHYDEATGDTTIVAINSRVADGRVVATRLQGDIWEFVAREVRSDP